MMVPVQFRYSLQAKRGGYLLAVKKRFYKKNPTDQIWWVEFTDLGTYQFSFDKIHVFNLFMDYPWKLSAEQKEIFDSENPCWHDFFSDRQGKQD